MARRSAAAPFVSDPYTADFQTRPFEIDRELRDEHPVHHRLLASFGAANHDDRVFDDPDRRSSHPELQLRL